MKHQVTQDTNRMDESLMDESVMGVVRQRSTRALDEILAEEAQEWEDSQEPQEEGRARAPSSPAIAGQPMETNNEVTMDQSLMDESLMGVVRQRSTRALDEILAEEAQELVDSQELQEEGRARAPSNPAIARQPTMEANNEASAIQQEVNNVEILNDIRQHYAATGDDEFASAGHESSNPPVKEGTKEESAKGEIKSPRINESQTNQSLFVKQLYDTKISAGKKTSKDGTLERSDSDELESGTGHMVVARFVLDEPPGAYSIAPGEVPERLPHVVIDTLGTDVEDLDLSDTLGTDVEDQDLSERGHAFVESQTAGGNNGLAVAEKVEDPPETMAEAQELRTRKHYSSKGCAWLLVGVALLVVLTVVPVAVILGKNEDSDEKESLSVKDSPSSSATFAWALDLPNLTMAAILGDADSPQARAYQWLQEDPSLSTYSETRMLQRFVLATLYHSTNGEGWVSNKGWVSYDSHECYDWWSFVPLMLASGADFRQESPAVCNQDDEYTFLVLPKNDLMGTLPPELGLLRSLRGVVLGGNHLGGSIPSQIWGLSELGGLALNSNILTGELEPEMFQAMQHNMLYLDLADNMLKGTMPTELGLLQATFHLGLNDNVFTGTIATELGQMVSMERIALSANRLTGSIPSDVFQNWQKLTHLEFRENPITGTIPSQIGRLTRLKEMYLYHCYLSGHIPSEIGLLSNMTNIVMSDRSSFSGSVPEEIWRLPMLREFMLGADHGALTGSIPTEVGLWSHLGSGLWSDRGRVGRFDVTGNKMSGTIPSQLGLWTALTYLGLQGTGTVPNEIWDLPALTKLTLDGNITGTIPEDAKALNGLSFFNISTSSLVGTLPVPLCSLPSDKLHFNCSESLCGCSCPCAGQP